VKIGTCVVGWGRLAPGPGVAVSLGQLDARSAWAGGGGGFCGWGCCGSGCPGGVGARVGGYTRTEEESSLAFETGEWAGWGME
jgi:hypothetical protein